MPLSFIDPHLVTDSQLPLPRHRVRRLLKAVDLHPPIFQSTSSSKPNSFFFFFLHDGKKKNGSCRMPEEEWGSSLCL